MPKITSKDCVQFIIDNDAPGTTPKMWKRVSKRKEGQDIVRVFHNEYLRISMTVYECNGTLRLGKQGDIKKENPTLSKLKENRIKVNLTVNPADLSKWKTKSSGRVIYDIGENEEDDEFDFYCGPETEDGALHDSDDGGCYEKLAELFSDIPEIEIGAAENYHTVSLIPGISAKDLWAVMIDRLERSGAIKMEDN